MENVNGISVADMQRFIEYTELQKKSATDLKSYYETLRLMKELERSLLQEKKMQAKIEKRLYNLEEKRKELKKDANYLTNKNYENLLKEIKLEKANLIIAEQAIELATEKAKITAESLNTNNLIVASTKTMGKLLVNTGQKLKLNLGYYLEQQKAVKVAGLNMGILSKQSSSFANSLYKSSLSTNLIGVDTKMLSKMQGDYSEEMGRTLQLTDAGNQSMAALAKGTSLGSEGAAQFAADMDNFGISAEGSKRTVDTLLNTAHKMGVNASASTKKLADNLKLANKFNFKSGIKGLGDMVALSLKYKVNMDSVSNFAEGVQDIEGAVEAAAKLQVLGGNWSKLGDPFQLMYKSRNDLKGFTEDIINATDVTGEFDKSTGEFKITALELSRLREVAKATNMDFENLSQMVKETAKNSRIKNKLIGFDKGDQEFLSSLATFDEKKKEYVIKINGDEILINDMKKLRNLDIKAIKNQQEDSKERAKNAMTFDETWEGMKNTLKSTLLPGFEAFATAMSNGLTKFTDYAQKSGFIDKITTWGRNLGEFAATAVKWISDNPVKSMIIGATALLAKESSWLFRGMLLGKGFNTTASIGGGNSSGLGNLGMSKDGGFKNNFNIGKSSSILKLGGAIAGLTTAYSEYNENSQKGMSTGENLGRSGSKGLGAGLGAWGGAAAGAAAAGAALGSVVPVIGTAIGALIGGALGAWGGSEIGEVGANAVFGQENQDFIARPGADPIPFSSADTLVGLKKDGGIGKALVGNSVGVNNKDIEVTFKNPIKFEGNINVNSSNGNTKIDLMDPLFIRALTKIIQEELTRNISGGKLSSNPV
jgi:hypothetical protein